MNDNLFKLKKDGKTVGYLQLRGNVPSPATAAEKPLTAIVGLIWYNAEKTVMALQDIELQWDTAHSFVTRDKNSKDVFAGDEITYIPSYGFGTKILQTATVYFCDKRLAFCVKNKGFNMRIKHNCTDIELIEDKKDE